MTPQPTLAAALECFRRGDAARASRELEALIVRDPQSAAAHTAGIEQAASTCYRRFCQSG